MLLLIFLGIVVVFCYIVFKRCVIIIPSHCFSVVERLGHFSRVLTPGIHVLVPFYESQRWIHWTYM